MKNAPSKGSKYLLGYIGGKIPERKTRTSRSIGKNLQCLFCEPMKNLILKKKEGDGRRIFKVRTINTSVY